MKIRTIRRLIAAAASLLIATVMFVAPVLAASAITRSTRLPGRLEPVAKVVKVPPASAAGSLVTRTVWRASAPAAGYDDRGESLRPH